MSLLDYERRFSALRVNTSNGRKSPYKATMLLAVIKLISDGKLTENCIKFDDELKREFSKSFDSLAAEKDRSNAHLPYFYLRSEGFWHHKVKPGKREAYTKLTTLTSPGAIEEFIEYVFLDDELFELLGHEVARELLKSTLERHLDKDDISELLNVGKGWSWLECEILVNDYMNMLDKELAGTSYNKAEHRRILQPELNGRSEGSIEYKHQNVSAVLLELGMPYIPGYKPAFNFQQQLKQVFLSYFAGNFQKLTSLNRYADSNILDNSASGIDWRNVIDSEPPEKIPNIAEPQRQYLARLINFTEREQLNRKLGELGEKFVLEFEKRRLTEEGRPDLASEVEWSSRVRGDGLGFDIRSFDANKDSEIFLEVKSTISGKYQPFYMTENERYFSKEHAASYCLYRVYAFRSSPRIFRLSGDIEKHVHLLPRKYQARF